MTRGITIKASVVTAVAMSMLAFSGAGRAQGASAADFSGTYQCKPNPSPCTWSGATASMTQSGKKLQIKAANGATADATATSDSTIAAGGTFNSLGIIRPDKSIDWSDGTTWTKH